MPVDIVHYRSLYLINMITDNEAEYRSEYTAGACFYGNRDWNFDAKIIS